MAVYYVSVESFEDVKEVAKVVTAKGRAQKEVNPPAPSAIGKTLLSIWDKSDLNKYKGMDKLFAVLAKELGKEELIFPVSKGGQYDYLKYAMVVPLEARNDHNYLVGKPFFLVDPSERHGIRQRGEWGNTHDGEWRYATDEEIDAFFAAFPDAAQQSLIDSIT